MLKEGQHNIVGGNLASQVNQDHLFKKEGTPDIQGELERSQKSMSN